MADRSMWDLGDYLDEIDAEVNAFDVFVRQLEAAPSGADSCSHGLFIGWNQYVNAPEAGTYDTGEVYGWRAFYVANRGVLDRILHWDDPTWVRAELYEEELIRFWDLFSACGATPSTPRPEPAHQPPPPDETTSGQIATGLKWAGAIGLIAAIGYAMRGIPRGGGNGGS